MTCIVGIRTETGVMLGADSLSGSYHGDKQLVHTAKLVTKKTRTVHGVSHEVLMGFTTSWRMGNILQFMDDLPPLDGDVEKWLVKEFVPLIRTTFKDEGYLTINNGVESGGNFLIGVNGVLAEIQGDMSVLIPRDRYSSVGAGTYIAIGAMHTATALKQGDKEILMAGLSAAEAYNPLVSGPFYFIKSDSAKGSGK